MPSVVLPCMHCGSVGTFTLSLSNGSCRAQCRSCHQGFWIEVRNGQVYATKK